MEAPELENIEYKDRVYDYIFSSKESDLFSDIQNFDLSVFDNYSDKLDLRYSYYNIYYRDGKREKIESKLISLSNQLSLNSMFLVNFIDEKQKEHIRFRYIKNKEKDSKFEDYLNSLILSEDIYYYDESLFFPEINRYGGNEIAKVIYEFFSIDTICMNLLKEKYDLNDELNGALYLSSFILIELLGDDLDHLYDYLSNSIEKDSKLVKEFSRNRKFYCDILLKSYEDCKTIKKQPLIEHKKVANNIISLLNNTNIDRDKKFYLIKSIIHMSMNRHFPFNRELENKVNQFLRFGYSNLKYVLGKEAVYE